MKILHVGAPISDFVGNFGLIFKCSRKIQELGHTVTIVTTDADCYFFDKEKSRMYQETRRKLQNAEKKPVYINDLPIYALHCKILQLGMYCPNASKFAHKIIPEYDIVHTCSWYNHVAMEFAKVATELNVPVVISSWGSLLPTARKLNYKIKWFADQIYTKKILKKVTAFQSVGNSETEEFIRLGAKSENIYRIDNPVTIENFTIKNRKHILKKIGVDITKQKYLLYLGRIHEKKGIELLLNSFEKIEKENRDLILIIAGSGTKNYEIKIKDIVSKMNLDKKIKFTGLIDDDEKLELLESAKLFVLTSHSDVHPIAVQDALVMGVPVVITEACDYPEVEEYNAGIIVQPNSKIIYEDIKKLLNDDERLGEMSNNAKKLVRERFILSIQVEKYVKMYEKILANKS